MMGANPEKEYKTMFENGTFAVLGPVNVINRGSEYLDPCLLQ